jgi:hypothetical protein
MKESAILQDLEEIAEKINLKVCRVNLRKYSCSTKSGMCRVRGEPMVIIDKHLLLSEKIDVLIEALQNFDLDVAAVNPNIKKLLQKRSGR